MELLKKREKVLLELKEKVASDSLSILSNPEQNILKLKELIKYLNTGENDPNIKYAYFSVQKLISYSIVEIFKNILPDYCIEKDDLEIDKKTKLKKSEYLSIKFEQRLLAYYKLFIDELEKMSQLYSKKRKVITNDLLANPELRKKLSIVSMQCMCQLISNKPYFNFTDKLVKVAVQSMILTKLPELQKESCEAFKEIFLNDQDGDISWLLVKEITKLIKTIGMATEPEIIETFLNLNIKQINLNDDDKKENMKQIREKLSKMSRKEKKQNKMMQKFKKDLLQNDIEQNKQKIANVHTQILSQIFSIYFRVLKLAVVEVDIPERFVNYSKILSPVLEGLARFAHLINIDFFEDTFNILDKLLLSNVLSERQNFHCLITIFLILSGHGEVLNVDAQRFYAHFYKILLSIDLNSDENDILMVLRCINLMIMKCKKNVTINRVLGFLKRFSTISLSCSSELTLALLSIIRFMLNSFSRTDILIDNESFGTGVYNPDYEDPEFSNAHSTQLYELNLLKNHFNELVQNFSQHILTSGKVNKIDITMLRKNPIEILQTDELDDNYGLPKEENVIIAKKKKFHGYIFNEDSLTQQYLKNLEYENNLEKIEI